MADERIDIEVNDKVSTGPEKKLRAIGDAAGTAHTYVERLKTELASINTSALLKLETASNSTTRALAQQMNAQARLEAATAKAALSDAKAATEKQKLATETARTEAAQARAAAAASNAATASLRAAAAAQKAASGTSDYSARAERLKASLDPLYAAQSKFNAEVNEAKTLLNNGAINMRTYVAAVGSADAKLKAAQAAQNSYNQSLNRMGNSAKLAGHHQANLVAQINDIGVSLASGQNPFIVLIQQGSQLQDLSMRVEGGFKTLAASVLRMVAPFAAAAAVAGVLYAKLALFKNEVNDDAGLKAYAETLGLTKKEMKELTDVTVTWGDLASGVWQTVKEAMNLDEAFGSIMDAGKTAVDFIWQTFKNFSFGLQGLMTGLFEFIRQLFTRFPAIVGDAILTAVNATIDGINWLAQKSNEIVGTSFGTIDHVTNKYAGTLSDVWTQTTGAAVKGFEDAERGYNAFVNRVTQNTIAASRKRLKAQAQTIIEDRGAGRKAKEDHTAENRAKALADVNLQLDNEISRMKLLKDERAVQQRFDQIEEQLARKKITLTAAEASAIRSKIEAIEAEKYVQTERDRIMEEADGPQRTMNAAIDAATQLYDAGKISVERYSAELQKATRAFDEATDPTYKFNQALDEQYRLLGKYGDELADATYLESIRQEYQTRGLSIYDESTGKLKEEVAALVAKNAALREQQQINSTISEITQPIVDRENMLANEAQYYAELDRMRRENYISEEGYARAQVELNRKFNELKLKDYTDFFDTLAGLSSSSNSTLAAIGKAAAISQATINMYVAASEALKLPFPANLPAIAQVIATGAQLVSAISSTNAGNFAAGGSFMVEGRAGVDTNNVNMNLTRGERVTVETPAQQRANDNVGNGQQGTGDVAIYNLIDVDELAAAVTETDTFERAVINKIKANPNVIQAASQ